MLSGVELALFAILIAGLIVPFVVFGWLSMSGSKGDS